MAKKKVFTVEELNTLSTEEIIDKINHENYSLLNSLGGEKLRKEMVPIGRVCHAVLKYFYHSRKDLEKDMKNVSRARAKIAKTLKRIAPFEYEAEYFPKSDGRGLAIGFNHPSLGEVLRILSLKFILYPDKTVLWPVNLPWYEAIAKDYDSLSKIGIIITPTLTPSTWQKLQVSEDSPIYDVTLNLKKNLRKVYTKRSSNIINAKGMIFVAPSATRQATVFKSKAVYDKKEDIIPTMSVLAIKLIKETKNECDYLPLAVMPPKKAGRSLNLFKKYTLIPAKPFSTAEIKEKYLDPKNPDRLIGFDYDFHMRIAERLPKKYWY